MVFRGRCCRVLYEGVVDGEGWACGEVGQDAVDAEIGVGSSAVFDVYW